MGMNVGASRNRLDCFADGPAIFDDRFVLRQVAHGNFVAKGNIAKEFDAACPFALERHSADARSLFQISDGDAHVVAGFMQKNSMFHSVNVRECELRFFNRADGLKVSPEIGNIFLRNSAVAYAVGDRYSIPKQFFR